MTLYQFCIRALLLLGLLPAATLQAQETLQLTFGHGQQDSNRYTTRSYPRLHALDGTEVILQRSRGTDYRVQAGERGWTWFQVQQVPVADTYIAITPQVKDAGVTLQITYSDRTADEAVFFSSTVSGDFDEWLPLVHFAGAETGQGSKRYSSSTAAEPLSVKVQRAQ